MDEQRHVVVPGDVAVPRGALPSAALLASDAAGGSPRGRPRVAMPKAIGEQLKEYKETIAYTNPEAGNIFKPTAVVCRGSVFNVGTYPTSKQTPGTTIVGLPVQKGVVYR